MENLKIIIILHFIFPFPSLLHCSLWTGRGTGWVGRTFPLKFNVFLINQNVYFWPHLHHRMPNCCWHCVNGVSSFCCRYPFRCFCWPPHRVSSVLVKAIGTCGCCGDVVNGCGYGSGCESDDGNHLRILLLLFRHSRSRRIGDGAVVVDRVWNFWKFWEFFIREISYFAEKKTQKFRNRSLS